MKCHYCDNETPGKGGMSFEDNDGNPACLDCLIKQTKNNNGSGKYLIMGAALQSVWYEVSNETAVNA